MQQIDLIQHYLLRFKANDRAYSPEHAKKKNGDIRKIVMTDGPEEKRVAIQAAWDKHYEVKKNERSSYLV